jgi:elongation factor Ts
LNGAAENTEALLSGPLQEGGSETVNQAREALIAKIGENVNVRRFARLDAAGGNLYSYSHSGRIGVLVGMQGGDAALGKDIAMHVAASNPVCVSEDDVPAEMLAKEREIFKAQAAESGKPDNIIEKIVGGRVRKYLAEITLLGQPFIKDPDVTVEKLLTAQDAKVMGFQRFEVGEGIEKKTENFADEVMAQVRSD